MQAKENTAALKKRKNVDRFKWEHFTAYSHPN